MQLHQKNNIRMYSTYFLLFPITGALFLKKPAPVKSSEENTLDFHLNMIKKIDELLQKHDKEIPIDEPAPMVTEHAISPQVPVESRPQFERRLGHIEPDLAHSQEPLFPKNHIPEEFKADLPLGMEPEFKFITSLDPNDNTLHFKSHQQDRIEIIDLSEFTTDDISSHLTTPITIADFRSGRTLQKKQTNKNKQPFVVLDTRVLNQKEYQDVFFSAAKQSEEIDKKKQVFYVKDSKTKKDEFKQNYVPEDFEERAARILKEKLQQLEEQDDKVDEKIQKKLEKESQQKRELEEKERKQLEKEEQKKHELDGKERKQLEKEEQKKHELEEKEKKQLEKAEQKKHEHDEKVKKQLEKEREKLLKFKMKIAKAEEKREQKKDVSSESLTKKPLKEQERLERIMARKAIYEERLKYKREKQMLKEQVKHRELIKSDEIGKYNPEPAEIDSDIKKILQITDELLGELPEDVINRFMQSDEYDLYERILNKYKIR
jgi:hypothetical protein